MPDLKIDRKLLPIKGHYFLFNAGIAPLMPYIPTYARQLGVSSSGVGVMYTFFPIFGLIAKPLFGMIADKFKCGKAVFIAAIIATAIFFDSIAFIPPSNEKAYVDFKCVNSSLSMSVCNVEDQCAQERISMEFGSKQVMECKMLCDTSGYQGTLNDFCNQMNLTGSCMGNSTLEFFSYSIVNSSRYESSCLYFPVDSIVINQTEVPSFECPSLFNVKCETVCNSSTVMTYIHDAANETTPYYVTVQYHMLFGFTAAAWAAQAVVVSLSDAICFNLLGDRPQDFGAQRLWGAVGWGLMTVVSGYLIDLASAGQLLKNYTPSFYLCAIILGLNALSVTGIRIDYHQEPYQIRKVVKLFKDVRTVLFLLSCVAFGACIGTVWQFHLWFLEVLAEEQGCESLKWIKLLEGLAMGVQCFTGEAPFLFLSGWFLKTFGHMRTMTIILIVMGVRLLGYSFLVNPWMTLPIDLLNGLTLGLYWATSASFAFLIAPPETASTLQGIFGALFEGVGTSLGSLVGGFIFEQYGGSVMFRGFGIFSLIFGSFYFFISLVIDWRDQRNHKKDLITEGTHPSDYGSLEPQC